MWSKYLKLLAETYIIDQEKEVSVGCAGTDWLVQSWVAVLDLGILETPT